MEMSDKIRILREKSGLTLEQVGNAVGVGKSTVFKWENGDVASMRGDKVGSLAAVLHTTPAYLMGWTQGDEPKGLLTKQLQLLSEKSKNADAETLAVLSNSMVRIYEALTTPVAGLQEKEPVHASLHLDGATVYSATHGTPEVTQEK